MRGRDKKVNSLIEIYLDPINDKVVELVDGYKEWCGFTNEQELLALEERVEELSVIYKEERENIINWREEFLAKRIREFRNETRERKND